MVKTALSSRTISKAVANRFRNLSAISHTKGRSPDFHLLNKRTQDQISNPRVRSAVDDSVQFYQRLNKRGFPRDKVPQRLLDRNRDAAILDRRFRQFKP